MKWLLLTFILLSSANNVFAEERVPSSLPTHYQYNLELDRYQMVRRLEPTRVYFIYVTPLKKWQYVRTNAKGEYPNPAEFLAVGSVLGSKELGGSSQKNFRLFPDGSWRPTKESKKIRAWNLSTGSKSVKTYFIRD